LVSIILIHLNPFSNLLFDYWLIAFLDFSRFNPMFLREKGAGTYDKDEWGTWLFSHHQSCLDTSTLDDHV